MAPASFDSRDSDAGPVTAAGGPGVTPGPGAAATPTLRGGSPPPESAAVFNGWRAQLLQTESNLATSLVPF